MKQTQTGFTLIELVMVIVILGVLAAVALPKFVDLKTDAQKAAIAGVAGALSSASTVNYAARKVSASKGVAVLNCTDVAFALQGGLPTSGGAAPYTITAAGVAVDASVTCTLTDSASNNATFTAIGIL